jgi:hypothetical protein
LFDDRRDVGTTRAAAGAGAARALNRGDAASATLDGGADGSIGDDAAETDDHSN